MMAKEKKSLSQNTITTPSFLELEDHHDVDIGPAYKTPYFS